MSRTYKDWCKCLRGFKGIVAKRKIFEYDEKCKNIEDYVIHNYKTDVNTNWVLTSVNGVFGEEGTTNLKFYDRAREVSCGYLGSLQAELDVIFTDALEKYEPKYGEQYSLMVAERKDMIEENIRTELELITEKNWCVRLDKERNRDVKSFHTFTEIKLSQVEEQLLQKSGGDVIHELKWMESSDMSDYLSDTALETILNFIKKLCYIKREKSSKMFLTENIRQEIIRCASNPNVDMKMKSLVLSLLDDVEKLRLAYTSPCLSLKMKQEAQILETVVKELNNREDIILRESDKKLGFSINTVAWYKNEYARQLNNVNYIEIGGEGVIEGIVKGYKGDLDSVVQVNESIMKRYDKVSLYSYLNRKVNVPFLNLLPKVHKLKMEASPENEYKLTARPIITAHSWCTLELAKYLRKELKNILEEFKYYMVSSGLKVPSLSSGGEFTQSMRSLKFSGLDGYLFVTYDFKDLYTNVSYESAKSSLENVCRLIGVSSEKCEFMLSLYNLYNSYNYFQAGAKVYKQQEGLSMGCYFSVEISDIVLSYSEYLFLLCSDDDVILLLKRYIDDGILVFRVDQISVALNILEILVSLYPSNMEITFKMNNKCFDYLDQSYTLDNLVMESGQIRGTVYFKEHHKFQYVSPKSNHNRVVLKNIVKNESIRYSRISNTETDYKNTVKLLIMRLKKIGYRYKFIKDNLVNYKDVCPKTLKYIGSRNSEHKIGKPMIMLMKVFYDKHYRLDLILRKLFERASKKNGVNVKVLVINILQRKVRELLSTRKILHRKIQ